MNSICNNVLLEHYRSKSKKESSLDEEPETVFVHQGPTALSMLETQDTTRTVRKILSQLTERDRNLLEAVLLDERDKDIVCAEFGINREYLKGAGSPRKTVVQSLVCTAGRRKGFFLKK